ncbi:MAG: nitric oxide reductase activation protein [Thioploca sp.]|nr:nitric oxide reductase activation protein [Thioploca sp.]
MLIPPRQALTADQMEEYLDEFLVSVLSSRRTAAGIAQMLAKCARPQQEFVLHWVEAIARSGSAEMAYQFASHAVPAMNLMDNDGIEAWILHAMDIYDKNGLHSAITILQQVEGFSQTRKTTGLALAEIERVLETFITGLSGRHLKLAVSSEIYTDTETLFLPALLNHFATRSENFLLYKAMAAHLWAQTRFGTWRLSLNKAIQHFPQPELACQLFHTLERLRLDACIARELPGLYRDMNQLLRQHGEVPIPPTWQPLAKQLSKASATVQNSYDCLSQIYTTHTPYFLCYQGILMPERVEEVMALRLAREKEAFRIALVHFAQESFENRPNMTEITSRFAITPVPNTLLSDGFQFELHLDGQPIVPPDKVKSLMDSIIQDIGMIPEEYLVAAGDGGYKIRPEQKPERDPETVWQGVYHEEGAFLYNEWDYHRKHYRKNWCVLREKDVYPQPESFVTQTLQRHRGLVKHLRRTFEALRGEDKLLKAQPNGENIDLEALVTAYADAKHGLEMTNRLFVKMQKDERNIAVMLMVDMSGSTKGWINDAEREALVLLCEALETLGDRYAIYGFSGMTRKRCEIYRVKQFNESYTNLVQQRISGITPQDYTRMGVAIRHLSQLLNQVDARIKLLITLSDGKPDDYGDHYRGTYGIEDTRQALIEAKRDGIHPFCITLDTEAKDYLPHMYGVVNYIVIDEVRKLPLKVSDIYRKLTS